MHVIDKIDKIENNEINLTNHIEYKIWSQKHIQEKTQLEGDVALLCLSLNRNGWK